MKVLSSLKSAKKRELALPPISGRRKFLAIGLAALQLMLDRGTGQGWFGSGEIIGEAVIAGVGIYGILAGSVTERKREIGVRAALGASRRNILILVLRQGMTLVAIGATIGLAAAILTSQALVPLLFGISKLDPVTYLGVIALLLSVSAIACLIPARRAASVNPVDALRAE